MTDLAQRLARLSSEQRALLERQLDTTKPSMPGPTITMRVQESSPLPLSFAQQSLWLVDQLAPGNSAYNSPVAVKLTGELNVAALHQGLNEVVRRHEVLRTSFALQNGQPAQVINRAFTLPLPIHDFSNQPENERGAIVSDLACEEIRRPFDLAHGPLLRVRLLRLASDQHVLLLVFHHIVIDAWSIVIFVRELNVLYTAYQHEQPSPLPALPIQYADYALWQRRTFQGAEVERLLTFWRNNLADLPILDLPSDYQRSKDLASKGAKALFILPLATKLAIQTLSRQEHATLFMTLLAAFKVLLARYSDQEDIVVGSSVSGRGQKELDTLIGFFVNILVLRTDLSGAPSFRTVLRRVRETCLQAYAHQDLPFERLVAELHPERDPIRTPFFQVLFQSVEGIGDVGEVPGLVVESFPVNSESSKFDLLLNIRESEQEIIVDVEYSTALFTAETIERMLEHYRILLEEFSLCPDRLIRDVSLLTQSERQNMLDAWNQSQSPYPEQFCLHELFEAQVELQPEALAVLLPEAQLTYRELNQRANQLAHYLRARGVVPNVFVGICTERSVEWLVGLMAVAKAGGAYVPLDPAYPVERLAFMIEDARVHLLLTQQHLVERLPARAEQLICLETAWPEIAQQSLLNPTPLATPDDLVYMIYTSGSTGQPKGVMLDHRGRVNNFCDFNTRFAVGSTDRLLSLSSLSFDMCAYDVFGTLAAGATIVLPVGIDVREVERWSELLVRHRVSIWHSVPALLEMLVDFISTQPELVPSTLHVALLGGDWIPVSLPQRMRALVPEVQVISLGGATEASMDSIIYQVEEVDSHWQSIPYGRPMWNQRAYILDAAAQLVPIGVPGELYLGGVGLAWGYFKRPDLTAERFLPHPFATAPGERLYKTGDLARYGAGGVIELLGRIDHQVKIRGLRIELGEIEAVLRQHPLLYECVVVARTEQNGLKRLIAYVLPIPSATPAIAEVQQFLKARLPEYMIPAAIVVLDKLPLTPNGKVDRRGLPVPEQVGGGETASPWVAPRTPTEQQLAGIWADLLGLERVGIHENFFAVGGDSILSIQVIVRARQVNLVLTPRQLFEHQTIAEIAQVVGAATPTQAQEEPASASMQPLAEPEQSTLERLAAVYGPLEAVYPLGPMQWNMLFQQRYHPHSGLYVIQGGFSLPAPLEVSALERAWHYLVARHAILRTTFVWEDGEQPWQLVHAQAPTSIEQQDWRACSLMEQEERMVALFQAERQRGFDLMQAPLMRLALIRLTDELYYFVMLNYYGILDGWSQMNMRKELLDCYQAYCGEEEPVLPTIRPYRDYVAWSQGQSMQEAQVFWRAQLRDFPRPPLLVQEGLQAANGEVLEQEAYSRHEIRLSAATTSALQKLAHQQQLTLSVLIEGAWALLLSASTQQPEVVFGVTFSGRPANLEGVEAMVGLFINTLPVRTKVEPARELLAWLKQLQVQQVEMQEYVHSSLLNIAQWVGLESGQMLFESILVFDNYPVDRLLRALGKQLVFEHPVAQWDYNLAQTEFPLRVDIGIGAELTLMISHYPQLVPTGVVMRMLSQLRDLLERIAGQRGHTIAEIVG